MKKILYLVILLLLAFVAGCEPEEDEESIRSTITTEREEVYNDAVAVANAAALYCAAEECSINQELTVNDVDEYIEAVDWTLYDTSATSDVVAIKQDNRWFVTLERTGTGDYEWPFNLDPRDNSASDALVDND